MADNELPVLSLPGTAIATIEEDAAKAYPGECCGLLVGQMNADGYQVVRAEPCNNLRKDERDDRYVIDPDDYLRVDAQARKDGYDIIGIFHSHPDHISRPSRFDADAAHPGYAYVIVSVDKGQPTRMQSWLFLEQGYFTEQVIEKET